MKFLTMPAITLALSLSMLTACGGSGGSGSGSTLTDPAPTTPTEPAVPVVNDLESLPETLTLEVNETSLEALVLPEFKATHSYVISGEDREKVKLLIEGQKVVFKQLPDFDLQNRYKFIITVTNVAKQSKSIDITINIKNIPSDLDGLEPAITAEVNENHRFAFTIPEYKSTNTYVFGGVDGDKVKLWPERGEVIFKYAPDYETQMVYKLVMTVTNAEDRSKDVDVTLNVKDISNALIFEVLAGSKGSIELQLNKNEHKFDTYSFSISSEGEPIKFIEEIGLGEKNIRRLLFKSNEPLEKNKRISISSNPSSANGLPNLTFHSNDHETLKIKLIQWGDNPWISLSGIFADTCIYDEDSGDIIPIFDQSAKNIAPNLTHVESVVAYSSNCKMNTSLSYWDVSKIPDLRAMFVSAYGNADLSQWDVSSATDMEQMFGLAKEFNSDLSGWNVSSVGNMQQMFLHTEQFNGDISKWKPSSAFNMSGMFYFAKKFNQDLTSWNVNEVIRCDGFNFSSALVEANIPKFKKCEATPPEED